MTKSYILGLDLGQTQDYSALAVLERQLQEDAKPVYALPHLQRWPLGTSYTQIVEDMVQLVRTPPLVGALTVVDQTGVGRPVVDLLVCSFSLRRF